MTENNLKWHWAILMGCILLSVSFLVLGIWEKTPDDFMVFLLEGLKGATTFINKLPGEWQLQEYSSLRVVIYGLVLIRISRSIGDDIVRLVLSIFKLFNAIVPEPSSKPRATNK